MIKNYKRLITTEYLKTKWNHVGFQKHLKNISWMFFGRFITLGISFFIAIYIARYLGPANYGLLNYVMSFVGLFGFITSFGIDGILSREIIKDHDKKDELIGTAFYIKIFGSLLAILSVFIISIFTTKDLFTLGLIWIFSLSFIPQAFGIIEIYFQSQVLSKKAVSAQIISNVVSAILKIVCIISDKGIFWLTLIYLVEASVYSGILLFSFRKFGNHLRKWKFNINIAKNLLSDSWPLMLSSVAIGIYMKIDQVMIKNMIGDEQAGIYAIAVKFSEVWYFIPAIICTSFFPSIINAKKINMTIYYKRLKRLFILMSSLAILISLSMFFISEFITDILLGNQYLQASSIIKIYIWSTVLVFGGTVISQYLVSKNYTKIFFYSNSIGAISNILLNLILIPKIGIVGASIATIISYSLSTIAIFIYKNTRIDLFNIIKIR